MPNAVSNAIALGALGKSKGRRRKWMDTPQILRELVWEREVIIGLLDDMLPLEFNDEDLEFLKEKETSYESNQS